MPSADRTPAWIDERDLGAYIGKKYGAGAERLGIDLVRLLHRTGLGDLHRRERFNDQGKRIGPDLKVPLETAALVMEVFAAAHIAGLRALARFDAGLPFKHVDVELIDLPVAAGCDHRRVGAGARRTHTFSTPVHSG